MEIKLIKYSGLLSYFSQACVSIGVQKKSMLDTLIRLDWKRQTHHQRLNENVYFMQYALWTKSNTVHVLRI